MILDKDLRPTFFELYAEQNLLPRIKQILRYVLQNTVSRPSLLGQLYSYDGSFSKRFYGLKQVSVQSDGSIAPLTDRLRNLLLLTTVVAPYCKDKLDTLYESWGLPYTPEGDESRGYIYAQQNIITQDSVSRAPYQDAYATISEKSLVNFQKKDTFQSIPLYEKNINIQSLQQQWEEQLPMYEKITTILQGLEKNIHILLPLQYLFNDYYTPWENLQKVCPVRLSQQDIIGRLQRIQKEAYDMNISYSSSSNTIFQRFYRTIRIISRILADSSRYIILIGIFVFKFLEWQNSSQNAVLNKQKLPTPPPPPPPIQLPYFDNTTTEQSTNNNENNSNVKLPSNPSSCSLCQRSKRINTACIPTGFSFCYSCIVDYIEKRHSCPITGVPLDVSSVRRVFDKSSQ